jgi:DNA-binding beta-propeller fold protein YncE
MLFAWQCWLPLPAQPNIRSELGVYSGAVETQWKRELMEENFMRRFCLAVLLAAGTPMFASVGLAQQPPADGPYKVLTTAKVGGEGGFDYVSADVEGRRLYVPRSGPMGQVTVYNLDTLAPAGTIPNIRSGGAIVDPKSHHGFSTTKPVTMWDSNTLQVIKTIDVDGRPDGIMFDPYNERVWVLSHMPPYATVIDGKEGTVVGTVDLGGQPEQAVSDDKGTVYVTIMDKANVAVVDAKKLTVTTHYDLSSKNVESGSGLSLDARHHILFSYWRVPSPVVLILNAKNGSIITTFPTDLNVDTVAFNPATMEAISTAASGSILFIKEKSPTSFGVEQKLQTMPGARTMVLDTKTNHVLTVAFEYGARPADAPPPVAGRPALGPPVPGSFTLLMVGRK